VDGQRTAPVPDTRAAATSRRTGRCARRPQMTGTPEVKGQERVVDDLTVLTDLNQRFVDAFGRGSWELLQQILSPGFSYLDGATGEVWPMDRYIADLEANPLPTIGIDQVLVHVDGHIAVVSARSFAHPGRFNR
jgi:hypothetical protein